MAGSKSNPIRVPASYVRPVAKVSNSILLDGAKDATDSAIVLRLMCASAGNGDHSLERCPEMRFARSRLAPLVSVLHLRHESHDVAFRVAEFGEPEVVVRHSGDQVRFGLRMNVVLHEACEGG